MGIYGESGESLERFVVVSCNFNVLMIHPARRQASLVIQF